jgi:ectoine hydroxylase-related dioxygenase (phytanoyl-CoA dioxygenase family)
MTPENIMKVKESVATKTMTRDEITSLQHDGAVALRQVVDESWRARLEAAIERDMESPRPFAYGYATDGQGKFYGNLRMWTYDADFHAFCRQSALPRVAQQFFDSAKVNLFYDQLFVKEPGTKNRTRWHNDLPYWPIRGRQILSFWVALDKTTTESGALEFIKGSHLWNRWFQPEPFGESAKHKGYERNPDYEPIPDVEAAREQYEILSWDLEPGDVYAFHPLTVHGAGGNLLNNTRRRGYAVIYTGDDVVYDTRPGTNPNLRNSSLAEGGPLDSDQYPIVLTTPRRKASTTAAREAHSSSTRG